MTLLVNGCNLQASGSGGNVAAVSTTGIVLYSEGKGNSNCNGNEITSIVTGCNATATGSGSRAAISNVGIVLYSSGGVTSFSANTAATSIVASTTVLTSTSTPCATVLGLCASPSPLTGFLAGNTLRLAACNVTNTLAGQGLQSALGSIPLTSATLSLSNISVTSAAPAASPVSCLSIVPKNFSTLDGVNVTCPIAGWAPGLDSESAVVYVQELVLNETKWTGQNTPMAQSFLPGLLADGSKTNESVAAFSAVRDSCAAHLRRWQSDPFTGAARALSVTQSDTGFSSASSLSLTPSVALTITTPNRPAPPPKFIITIPSFSISSTPQLSSTEISASLTNDGGCCLESHLSSTTLSSSSLAATSPRAIIQSPRHQRSALGRILGEQAAVGVTSASVAASVVWSSVFSSGAVTRVPIMRSLASSIRCAWVERELEDPSYFDLPLQFVAIGDHPKLKYYAGGLVLCGLFMLSWELVSLLCFNLLQGRLNRKVESMLGIGSLLQQGYLMPNVAQAAVIVCWHAGGGVAVFASAVVVLLVIGYSVCKWLWVLLPAQFSAHVPPFSVSHSKNGTTVKIDYSGGSAASQAWLRFFGPMFDGTVAPRRMTCRVLVMEEVTAGVLLSILGGIKPEDDESCRYTAASMLVVTVLHLLYLLIIRPYRTKLDAVFANINAFFMFCQGAFAVIITVQGLTDGPLVTCFATLGLLQLLLLFLQLIVGGFYTYMLKSRRRILEPEVDPPERGILSRIVLREADGGRETTALDSPLLQAPQSVAIESNPLLLAPPYP